MIDNRLPKVHPLHDKLAIVYYKRGYAPEKVLEVLKAANYKVSGYLVDAIVIANILRGIYLAQTIEPNKPKTRTKKSA